MYIQVINVQRDYRWCPICLQARPYVQQGPCLHRPKINTYAISVIYSSISRFRQSVTPQWQIYFGCADVKRLLWLIRGLEEKLSVLASFLRAKPALSWKILCQSPSMTNMCNQRPKVRSPSPQKSPEASYKELWSARHHWLEVRWTSLLTQPNPKSCV